MEEEVFLLNSRNINPTAMRILVLQVFMRFDHALTLSELEQKLERADKSTIFRTLKTFESSKLIHRISDGTGSEKYALCFESCECQPKEIHYHFSCERCNATYCMDHLKFNNFDLPKGFKISTANLVIKGRCPNC